jgi:hypothetical protein
VRSEGELRGEKGRETEMEGNDMEEYSKIITNNSIELSPPSTTVRSLRTRREHYYILTVLI